MKWIFVKSRRSLGRSGVTWILSQGVNVLRWVGLTSFDSNMIFVGFFFFVVCMVLKRIE